MSRLKDHNWVYGLYNSDSINILEQLVFPMLRLGAKYDRSVGYLKKSHLVDVAEELFDFCVNGGQARFLIGDPLDNETLLACQAALGERSSELLDDSAVRLRELLKSADFEGGDRQSVLLVALQFLIAKRMLDIRLALRQSGIHHPKIRVAVDSFGDCVVAIGSDNDSHSALTGLNREEGSLSTSWLYPGTDYWETHGSLALSEFESLWSGKNEQTLILTLSDQIYLQIEADWSSRGITVEDLRRKLKSFDQHESDERTLRPYQDQAIDNWYSAGRKGIFALCTGAGKTFTSITAASELATESVEQKNQPFVVVIAVPYRLLAEQWARELDPYFDNVFSCWSDHAGWQDALRNHLSALFGNVSQSPETLAIVVVNDTLTGDDFQARLRSIPTENLFFIADEVHRHGTETFAEKIPQAAYMLGLSATPWSSGEQERANRLRESYGDVIAEFGIGDALREGVLCPYSYFLNVVRLSEEESASYGSLSLELAQLLAIPEDLRTPDEIRQIRNLTRRRNSVLGNCREKLEWVDRYTAKNVKQHMLIYCAEGFVVSDEADRDPADRTRSLEEVAKLIDANGWRLGKITAEETSIQRSQLIKDFSNGHLDALLAIRVLDEGFDLPICKSAILLSSSSNERQFIQRRGRVLRNHVSKSKADIYDFLTLPARGSAGEWVSALTQRECLRAFEFSRFSQTHAISEQKMIDACEEFGIEYSKVVELVESRSFESEDE